MAITTAAITSNQTWNWPTGVVYANVEIAGASQEDIDELLRTQAARE